MSINSLTDITDMDPFSVVMEIIQDNMDSDSNLTMPIFQMDGNDYDNLVWDSNNNMTKPTESQIISKYNSIKNSIRDNLVREKIDVLLKESDKYLIKDFPFRTKAKKDEWESYRQDLRDLTDNLSNFNVNLNTFEITNFSSYEPSKPTEETGSETITYNVGDVIIDNKLILTDNNTLNNFLVADGTSYIPKTINQVKDILDLEIGTDIQGYDAGLTSIAGLTTEADRMIYTTAIDTYATTPITQLGRSFLADTTEAEQRTTLGLGSIATLNAPSGDVVGTSQEQILTNKTITSFNGGNNAIITTPSTTGTLALTSELNTFSTDNFLVTNGNVTIKNLGITNAQLAGSIDLATKVTGTLPVAKGGTGRNTFTSKELLIGNGTSAISSESNLSFDTDTLTISGSSGGKLKMKDSNNTHHYTLTPGDLSADISLTLPTTEGTLALTSYVSANPGSGSENITTISIGETNYIIPDTNTEYTAGDGLQLTNTAFSLDLNTNSGLVFVGNKLSLNLSATGISGTLSVADGGTGRNTFTSKELLIGNGTSAISSESNLSFDTDTLTISGSSGGKLKMKDSNNTHHYTLTPGDLSADISLTLPTTQGTLALTSELITGVSAGYGLTGGGSSGSLTISVGAGDGITASSDEIEVSVDGTTIELSATDGSGVVRAKTEAIADGGTALATADQIHTFVTGQGYLSGANQTNIVSIYNSSLKIGRDTNTLIDFGTGGKITCDGDITTSGTLEVQGGEIKFWGQEKINNSGGYIWTISSPSTSNSPATLEDSNLVINNKGGFSSLTSSAHSNIAIGASSGDYSLTSGQRNIFLGYDAGKSLTTGSKSIFIGYHSGQNFTTIGENICIGDESGKYAIHTNSSSNVLQGSKNIFLGERAGYHMVGYYNIAIGYNSGSGEATDWGSEYTNNNNISIGTYALSNYTGHSSSGWGWNNAFGSESMRYIKDGIGNVSHGHYALRGHTTAPTVDGSYNTSIGHMTMIILTTGDNNVALGSYAGYDITAGSYNTLLGSLAGRFITTGSYNICIGRATGPNNNSDRIDDSNRLYIDASASYKEENSLIYGDQSGSTNLLSFNANVSVNGTITATDDITAYSSDKRLKKNIEIIDSPLEKLSKLSGFTYEWDKNMCEKAGFKSNDLKQIGVFAQDVKEVIPEAVKIAPFDQDENGKSKSGENYLTVQYEKIVPLLIEANKSLLKRVEALEELVKNK